MIILKLIVLEVLLVLGVSGNPVRNDCKFWWNVVGNHYDGGECETVVEKTKEMKENTKSRVIKRDDSASSSKVALNTIGSLMNIVNANLNLNIKTDAGVACKACNTGVRMMKVFTGLSKNNEDLMKLAVSLCVQLKIMTEDVCEGLIEINGPSIMYILKNSELDPVDICGFIIKTDCEGIKNENHLWKVDIPELNEIEPQKELSSRNSASEKETPKLKVLHISDTHFDPLYKEGVWAECTLPLCCREIHGEPTQNATLSGPWGGWKCDIPEKTLDNLLDHINHEHPDIDYVIWTGDIPPHDSWSLYRNDSLDILNKTLSKMLKHFPNIPVYPALGNHETVPPNLFPTQNYGDEWSVDWLYEELEKGWQYLLKQNSSETVRHGAFYTMLARPGLRIISLNMNFCYYNNWWLILNSTDPKQELKWLVEVLQQAEKDQEKVHIIGHIPAGYNDCLQVWQENYYNIIKRFNKTVVAQFFGHTHTDEFELIYDQKNLKRPLGVAYVGPSVTTYTYLNPGYRIYYIDGDYEGTTRMVTDHETWIMDLEKANENNSPIWHKMYSAKEAYNMPSLTPQDWHNFFEKLYKDQNLWELYYKHYWKDSPRRPPCGEECKKKLFCGIRSCDQYGQPANI